MGLPGLQGSEGIGTGVLRAMLQEFASADAKEDLAEVRQGLRRCVSGIVLVSEDEA